MKFGVYIHIPHCLQQCSYCDFATLPISHKTSPADYASILIQEIEKRNPAVPYRSVSTIYFGGGTPSLMEPEDLGRILDGLRSSSFDLSNLEEMTLEINPGTIHQEKLLDLLRLGFTRFSVGAQTFSSSHLASLGREHSVDQTRETLALLQRHRVSFTADLLFGLPDQDLKHLQKDIESLLVFEPKHLSAYCLTLPEKHPLNRGRPEDDVQAEMFYFVERELEKVGLHRYEVSNFAVPGHESKHNQLYWQDAPYWGLGLGAHSYFHDSQLGVRFWNPNHIEAYRKQVAEIQPLVSAGLPASLPQNQAEFLTTSQSLTDFIHTQLRRSRGLSIEAVEKKYGLFTRTQVEERLERLLARSLVRWQSPFWTIDQRALVLSEQVFQEMTFLATDLL